MPKTASSSGSFSDLYDAMQQRTGTPQSTAPLPSVPPSPALYRPPDEQKEQSAEGGLSRNMRKVQQKRSLRPQTLPSVRPYGRTAKRRTITRYAFEFFQDQIDSLRRFSLDAKMQGEKGSMSEMVREALDAYISEKLGS
jgi:hypothetical protein